MDSIIVPQKPSAIGFRWLIPLWGIILLSFGLRLHNLNVFSFWTDEGLTPLRSGYSIPEILSNTITIQEGSGKDTHPPFYYLLIWASRRFIGETDFAYRYPSLLAGILLVPVMYQFGRRLKSRWLGVLAAGLTAVNPLQIWYAQEARMYTVLILLAALTSYVLWWALTGADLRRSLLLYLLLASLTIYTHYTAVFLIAAQSILWAWLLWRSGQQKFILAGTGLLLLAAIPLIPYTIPRLFTGTEANYYYVSPLIMLQDVIHGFGLGVTIDFKLISTKLLDLGALGLFILGIVAARSWLHRTFLLAYLYPVVFGLMAGSYFFKPMYQGVRHIMIGSPAFLLLLAWGILWLLQNTFRARRWSTAVSWGSLAALGVMTLATGPILSLNNLYTNPHYAKNNFKALITYVEQHAGENDLLLFNDAVLMSLYNHYQERTDIALTALPTYPYPANDRTFADLAALTQTYQRIWLVTSPPSDDRDNNGLVQGWLTDHLSVVDDHSFWGKTGGVQVIAFDAQPRTAAELPANGRSLNVQWPALPALRSIQLQFNQPAALPTLWINLFWEGGTQPDPGAEVRLVLRGPDDQEWSASRNRRLTTTAVSWANTPFVRQAYSLPIPIGAPPGIYTLYAEPLLADGDTSSNAAQPLLEIELAASSSWPIKTNLPVNTPSLNFQNGLVLLGAALFDDEVRPGHNLPFTLYWQADDSFSTADLRYEVEVIAPDGSILKRQGGEPGASWLNTWPAGAPIVERSSLYFGPEIEPGRYRLRWRLVDDGNTVGGRPLWRPWYSSSNMLGSVEVKPWPLVTTLPDDVNPVGVEFGPDIRLSGYTYKQTGDILDVTLYWQALAVPTQSYLSFVHLVAADGTIVAQQAFLPVNGLRPLETWRAGEIITDAYSLALPLDLPAGLYTINAGLFDFDTGERPSVVYQGQPQANNQFTLGTITLP